MMSRDNVRSLDLVNLDELDIEILKILMVRGRAGVREIARALDKPVSTISTRIRRLEERGVISGYTARVDYELLGFDVVALIMLIVDGSRIESVEKVLASEPNVRAVYDITGEYDVAIIAVFRRVRDLDMFIKRLLRNPYIRKSVTSIVFRRVKDDIHIDVAKLISCRRTTTQEPSI